MDLRAYLSMFQAQKMGRVTMDILFDPTKTTVNGLPAHEIVYQGKNGDGVMIIQQMELIEKSPGSQYFVLVGVDTVDHYDQERSTFNQIVNSFKFLS